MYIHRIVIDANRINTRGTIDAMNRLETLHALGLVEIFQTSTLPRELDSWPPGQQKAKSYSVLGGSSMFYLSESKIPDGNLGTVSRDSKFMQIHAAIFGPPDATWKKRTNDMRDALHIDQANQNDADFFVSNDTAILNASSELSAAGVGTQVCTAEFCEAKVREYFESHYGTSQATALSARLQNAGPVLLGSNSCGETKFVDNEAGEKLLAFVRTPDGIAIEAMVRAADGHELLTIAPNQPFLFHGPGAEVRMDSGPALLLLGEAQCRSFAVKVLGSVALAGRVLLNGRLLLYRLALYSASGQLALQLERDTLMLFNVTAAEYGAP